MRLSIVVPLYNEAANLAALLERLLAVLREVGSAFEIVVVDDGSRDRTLPCLLQYRQQHPELKVLSLARNFGKEAALTAGLDRASGDAVVLLDADLQDPPELIPELVAQWQRGYDMVCVVRRSRRHEGWLKRLSARAFYCLARRMSRGQLSPDASDFRLLDRQVVEALKRLPERTRLMKELFAWVGFRQTVLTYDRAPRSGGRSKWRYSQLWQLALDGLLSAGAQPLRVWGYCGLGLVLLALGCGSLLLARTLIWGVAIPEDGPLIVAMLLLSGIQLMALGAVGEYLSRLYQEVKGRPLYWVREQHGFDGAAVASQGDGKRQATPSPTKTDGSDSPHDSL